MFRHLKFSTFNTKVLSDNLHACNCYYDFYIYMCDNF